MDLIKLHEAIKLYEADKMGMEKGQEIESQGREERKKFISRYPIKSIPNLTIEQYTGSDSFSYWLHDRLCNIANIKSTWINHFEVYTTKKSPKICLSRSYEVQFGDDSEKAFGFLKNEIVHFLEDIKKKNYCNFGKYKIDSILKNMLMIVYFYERFVPVCVELKMNECLKNLNIRFNEKSPMVDKNLKLVEWKKTVPELAGWTNQIVLDFGSRWFNAKVVEKAQKIEAEITSLNIDGVSKKAVVDVRVNHGIFRDLLLERYSECCLCKVENPNLLIASHIKPWAESKPEERLDVDNGFLMCPNHDKLFDKGYITFDNNGKIRISKRLKENDMVSLNVDSKMHIHIKLTENNKRYLKFHRKKVFIDK